MIRRQGIDSKVKVTHGALHPLTFIFLALVVLLVIAKQVRNRNNKKLKPPHPPSWPIIGHLHLLNINHPIHRILSSFSERYGPIVHLQFGFRPVLLITSSDLAKECFTANDRAFASRPHIAAGKHLAYDFKMFSFAPYGPFWRNIRKICTLQLLSAHRIESLKHVRADEVSVLIRSLFENCRRGIDSVNMTSELAALTFHMIVRMVATKRATGAAYSQDSAETQHFKEMIDDSLLLSGVFNMGDYLPFLRWLDLHGVEAAMKKVQKKFDAFMEALVNDHRERRKTEGEYAQDLIDVLISATENHEILSDDNDIVVKSTAMVLIIAGADTSAVTIEWALAALLQNPNILKKAQEELDFEIGRDRVIEESDLSKLKYLEAIVKETLRLYPAAPLLAPRESTEACTVGGFHVPAGTRLIVNAWAIQRDPALWERPTEFDPDRFLKSDKEIDVKGQDFRLIPFSSGRRICPGMALALRVVSFTLARLLQGFEMSLPEGTVIDMGEGVGLTMPRAVPLEVVIQPRLPLHLY